MPQSLWLNLGLFAAAARFVARSQASVRSITEQRHTERGDRNAVADVEFGPHFPVI